MTAGSALTLIGLRVMLHQLLQLLAGHVPLAPSRREILYKSV